MEQRRSWFRIHLFTALVVMVAASSFLGINLARSTVVEVHRYSYTTLTVSSIGFPFPMRSQRSISDSTGSRKVSIQSVTLGELRPGVPRVLRLPSDIFSRDNENVLFEINSVPDIKYAWRSMDRPSLRVPEDLGSKPKLYFHPIYPGDYVFGCSCTDSNGNTVTLKTTLHVSTRRLQNSEGWNLTNAAWNAATGLFGISFLAALTELCLRRKYRQKVESPPASANAIESP